MQKEPCFTKQINDDCEENVKLKRYQKKTLYTYTVTWHQKIMLVLFARSTERVPPSYWQLLSARVNPRVEYEKNTNVIF